MLMFRDRGWHPAGAVVAALGFAFGQLQRPGASSMSAR